MRIFFLLFTFQISIFCFGQNNVVGIYSDFFGEKIELLSDSTFKHTYRFDLSSSWTKGKWRTIKDTLYLVAYNLSNKSFQSSEGVLFSLDKGVITGIEEVIGSDGLGKQVEIESESQEALIPQDYILYQNYPNPFNPATIIRYGLPEPQNVEIYIYSILGERVKSYSINEQPAGYHEFIWDSRNDFKNRVASGVYIYQIKAGKFIQQKKMILLK